MSYSEITKSKRSSSNQSLKSSKSDKHHERKSHSKVKKSDSDDSDKRKTSPKSATIDIDSPRLEASSNLDLKGGKVLSKFAKQNSTNKKKSKLKEEKQSETKQKIEEQTDNLKSKKEKQKFPENKESNQELKSVIKPSKLIIPRSQIENRLNLDQYQLKINTENQSIVPASKVQKITADRRKFYQQK